MPVWGVIGFLALLVGAAAALIRKEWAPLIIGAFVFFAMAAVDAGLRGPKA